MRKQFEAIKNGCPWLEIQGPPKHTPAGYHYCRAQGRGFMKGECHYKGCAILYWFRHIIRGKAKSHE